jgi:anti-anti-sigma factor
MDRPGVVVTWHGPLTVETVERLPVLVHRHLAADEPVLLDLSETPYLDSTALGTLVDLLEETRDRPDRLVVAGTYNIWQILDLVGLTEAYPGRILRDVPR